MLTRHKCEQEGVSEQKGEQPKEQVNKRRIKKLKQLKSRKNLVLNSQQLSESKEARNFVSSSLMFPRPKL